ncbi:hypothetical protein ABTP57_04540 [Acinetobacter baumannii]
MDKCREAFERFECEKYEANYDDMKKNWDWYESQFGYRYSPDSLRGKDWAIWQKAWQHRQAKVEELQNNINLLNEALDIKEQLNQKLREREDELQKRVDAALKLIESWNEIAFDKTTHWTEGYEEGCYHCAAQLEQALKGEG